jgi:hypothetical protein
MNNKPPLVILPFSRLQDAECVFQFLQLFLSTSIVAADVLGHTEVLVESDKGGHCIGRIEKLIELQCVSG